MSLEKLHFVISSPRSGSTWLARTLGVHPEIFATEHRLFGDFCEVWKNNDGSSSPRITFDAYASAFAGFYFHEEMGLDRPAFLQQFQTGFANFVTSFALRRTNANIVVDKITPYRGTAADVVQKLNRWLPNSRLIRLVRDGRDVATSGVFDWMMRGAEGTQRYDFFITRSCDRLDRFFDDEILGEWAEHWRETVEVWGSQDTFEVRYEDMVENQPRELMRLYEYLGVTADLALAEQAARKECFKNTTGREAGEMVPTAKARRGISGDWKNWFTRRDGELFVEIAGPALLQAGYESDHEWLQDLPDILAHPAS